MKENGRVPKRSKPSLASHREMAEVSSVRMAQEKPWTEVTEGVLPLATISADKRQRMSPRGKSGRPQKRARVEPFSRERTGPYGFSLPKVPAHIFMGVLEDTYINDIPSTAYAIARGSTLPANAAMIDDLPLKSAFITGLSAGVQASLYTKLKKVQEDAEYSTDKLLGTVQENENLKTQLIQAEKAEGRSASEHFESLQAEVLRLGAEVEGWLEKCREQNEDADRLREEVEKCRAVESEEAKLREEKDGEIAWLRAELEAYKGKDDEITRLRADLEASKDKEDEIAKLRAEVEASKEEARTAVENFKNSDDCRNIIYDHSSRLYTNGWVNYRSWLKEHNPYLDISKAKWPGEEEAEEEERLAKLLAEAEADQDDVSEDEGDAGEEVEIVDLDGGDQ
ncbi:hypothetical protein O6P43_032492 [Quillaja saponaria]|uniref:Uncharacterized protein n=1 Tax=Quillaja saponaria TaxID=32244 RepID=A0AAD7KNU0_QUISA|nr:hypothetical protein O6P43_032492 [Quillaja saponaria]